MTFNVTDMYNKVGFEKQDAIKKLAVFLRKMCYNGSSAPE